MNDAPGAQLTYPQLHPVHREMNCLTRPWTRNAVRRVVDIGTQRIPPVRVTSELRVKQGYRVGPGLSQPIEAPVLALGGAADVIAKRQIDRRESGHVGTRSGRHGVAALRPRVPALARRVGSGPQHHEVEQPVAGHE